MTESLRTDRNDFLFTPIAVDANGMHVTMLSALARSGVDPWIEATDLAALPREDATRKLVLMLAGVPNGPSPGADTENLAARLVEQLHSLPKPRREPMPPRAAVARDDEQPQLSFSTLPRGVRLTIYSLVALILMVIGHQALGSDRTIEGARPPIVSFLELAIVSVAVG